MDYKVISQIKEKAVELQQLLDSGMYQDSEAFEAQKLSFFLLSSKVSNFLNEYGQDKIQYPSSFAESMEIIFPPIVGQIIDQHNRLIDLLEEKDRRTYSRQ